MDNIFYRYPVQNPLLKDYIKFLWELRINQADIHHTIIPQRNISLRFVLNDNPQYALINGTEYKLDDINFSGLQDRYMNAILKMKGDIHIMGVSFYPEGLYPFIMIPVIEFKNQLLDAKLTGLKQFNELCEKLKETKDTASRLTILENELCLIMVKGMEMHDNFQKIFNVLKRSTSDIQITQFCERNNIGIRTMERLFNKYVGLSANSFCTLNRFHISMNQLLYSNYDKLSDLAFDNGFFDQMHFIRDFKRFTGSTPAKFVSERKSILQIGKFS